MEYSDSELLEYVALDRAKCRQEDGLMIAAKKAFNAKKYSKAASYFHQAVMLIPTFEAIYGRTSSLIHLGQLKEIPKAYQGGKSDKCFYHLYKARSTLMLMLEQEKFAADEFKLFINDAWNDVFELQQAMCHHHSSVGDCLRELKVLAENVDGSTSWDSVSMREKALKIMNIANILKHFQRKVRKLVEDNEISDAGSEHSSMGSSEVKENFKTYKRARLNS